MQSRDERRNSPRVGQTQATRKGSEGFPERGAATKLRREASAGRNRATKARARARPSRAARPGKAARFVRGVTCTHASLRGLARFAERGNACERRPRQEMSLGALDALPPSSSSATSAFPPPTAAWHARNQTKV